MSNKVKYNQPPMASSEAIEVIDAYEHNLKHIDVYIPKDRLVVITGIRAVVSPVWLLIPYMQKVSDATSRLLIIIPAR